MPLKVNRLPRVLLLMASDEWHTTVQFGYYPMITIYGRLWKHWAIIM